MYKLDFFKVDADKKSGRAKVGSARSNDDIIGALEAARVAIGKLKKADQALIARVQVTLESAGGDGDISIKL